MPCAALTSTVSDPPTKAALNPLGTAVLAVAEIDKSG